MKKTFKIFGYILLGFVFLLVVVGIFSGPILEENKILEPEKEQSDITLKETDASAGPKEDIQPISKDDILPSGNQHTNEVSENKYLVTRVVDGDTLSISKDGKNITIRLIGLDTPETVHPSKPVECFGREASNKAKSLLSGKYISLETDETQGEFDKYQRMLAYIYLPDGTMFNKYMIREGYAYEYTYGTPYKYQAEFKQAQKSAEENKKGLWADGVCEEEPSPAPASPVQNFNQVNVGNYSCSSNLYNCTEFSTHDEAQAVFEMCGGSITDVHKLDSEKDGLACETLP